MATSLQSHSPTPALIFKTLNAYQETEALRAAAELDVFTAIDEGAHDAPSIAARCQASARGIRILCDYLTVIGLLDKRDGQWQLTPDSALFLSRKSPANLLASFNFFHSPMLMEPFLHIAQAVRQGSTVLPLEGTMAPDHPLWLEFARSMASMMRMPAEIIAGLVHADSAEPMKVLDVAAGHGIFGIAIARHNPQAEIYAVDWKGVLEIARGHAQQAGLADRWHALPGSAFEIDLGAGYDVVLLTNFLHHFDPPTNEKLLRRMHAALKPGGRAVTLEFIPNDDRVTPPSAATFSLMMLGTTESGDAYTFAEYERMFQAAGFSSNELHSLPADFARVIVSVK